MKLPLITIKALPSLTTIPKFNSFDCYIKYKNKEINNIVNTHYIYFSTNTNNKMSLYNKYLDDQYALRNIHHKPFINIEKRAKNNKNKTY
jgi:hypothetical protein